MSQPLIWTFFYGSFINFDVLKQSGFVHEEFEVARLNGYDIRIDPLANLIRSNQHCVYGIVVPGTHDELHRLYAQGWIGTYLGLNRFWFRLWMVSGGRHFAILRRPQKRSRPRMDTSTESLNLLESMASPTGISRGSKAFVRPKLHRVDY
jgi:hypothetical protein